LVRIVVAIDPAVSTGEDADETGIIVAGKDADGHAAGADVRAAQDELADPLGVSDDRHHCRLPALRVAAPMRPRDADGVEQGDRGAHLDGVHPLAVDGARRW
jgi:hypothetical protein